jgi:PAS domain S-box-containing protein
MNIQADILDLLHESVITCDAAGTILSWNAASDVLYGWSKTEAIGHNIDQLLKTQNDDLAGLMATLLAMGIWEGELVRLNQSGEQRVLDVRWTVERNSADYRNGTRYLPPHGGRGCAPIKRIPLSQYVRSHGGRLLGSRFHRGWRYVDRAIGKRRH